MSINKISKRVNRQVVVTGMGILSPLESGKGLEIFWQELLRGTDAIKEVKSFDANRYGCNAAGEVEGFRNSGADRWIHFLDFAFKKAIEDAGLLKADPQLETLDYSLQDQISGTSLKSLPKYIGLCIGTVLGGMLAGEEAWKDGKQVSPETYHLFSGKDYLTKKYNIKGPTITISTACASGTDAIGIAYRNIMWGRTDAMIAGGADVLSEFAFAGFNSLKALAKNKIRPFDKKRDGLALSEGAAFLVLEEENNAKKRGAKIYGRISGYASRSDANHLTGPDKEGKGLALAITAALNEAGMDIVDYINAHGTGTIYNDVMETKAIKLVFGKSAYQLPISSVKSMIGHSFGAGGPIEAATCLLAIRDGKIPPTINYQEKDPECDLDYVPNTARKARVKTALSLSAGFGGQNAVLLFSSID